MLEGARRRQNGSASAAAAADSAAPDAGTVDMAVDGIAPLEWPLSLDAPYPQTTLGEPCAILDPLDPQLLELLGASGLRHGEMAATAELAEPEVPGAPQPWPALCEAELAGKE